MAFSERFEIRRLVGEGGMGAVYEGFDKETRQTVALKVFGSSGQEQRFEREAELLQACDDVSIVRYVAHGTTDKGELFLAMEWLDGVDLAARLEKGPLSSEDALEVTLRAATALQHAHERGIVHRDVKPSNVFLVGDDPRRVKLIDFGVARSKSKRALTRTNVFLGTVGYMAPEQVMGVPDVDGRADVFSLGCVLYECLAGTPAYAADEPLSVFAKLLVDEAPRIAKVRPDLPPALDAVLARMLARQRDQRYPTMAEAAADLRAVAAGEAVTVAMPPSRASDIGERRVVSFVAVDNGYVSSGDRTVTPDQVSHATGEVLAIARSLGVGKIIELDGILVFGTWEGGARDRAARAVSCALAIAEALPRVAVGVATGASDTSAASTDSDVIRRALSLARTAKGARGVPVDELTGDLTSEAFTVSEERAVLHARRASRVGELTPLVGRQRELAYLETSLAEIGDEQVARAVVVVGAEGSGKTRLVRTFVERNRTASIVLAAAAGSGTAAEPYAVLRQLLSAADALSVSSAPRPAQKLGAGEQAVLAALRTSSGEPLAPEAVARAVTAWLRRFPQHHGPVVLLLEDAHWADAPSVAALATALRALEETAVLLVATARPAGRAAAAGLLAWARTTELRLQPLSSRASETLLRSLLERDAGDELIERMVASADGNAFSLGMLARRVNRTGVEDVPDTVLALVVARLESLKDEERAVVRAASLFGRNFPTAAVAGVLEKETPAVEAVLAGLSAEDLFTEVSAGVYRFRHEMYARAAYEMIGPVGRKELHRHAAEVLIRERAAPLAVAQQFRYAGMNDEAAEWYVRVAGNAAHRLCPRRAEDERVAEEDGELEMTRAHAAIMHCHDDRLGVEWLMKGFAKARVGTRAWWRGLPLAVAIHHAGPAVAEVVNAALPRVPTAALPASREFVRELPDLAWLFGSLGLGGMARRLLERVQAEVLQGRRDPLLELSHALLDCHGPGYLGRIERTLEAATRAAADAGEGAAALNGKLYLGLVQGFAGRVDEGIATLGEVIDANEHSMVARSAKTCRAVLHGIAGRTQEGFRDLEAGEGDSWLALFHNVQRFVILQGAGRYEQAVAIARAVHDAFAAEPSVRVVAAAGLGELFLELGDEEAALAAAEDGLGILAAGDVGFASFHYRCLAIRARALAALEHPGAESALQIAWDRVNAELDALPGTEAREAFERLPLASWVLASAPQKPKRFATRDTLPQMRSPVGR